MRITGRLARHRAQAEALAGVEGGAFQLAVVVRQAFGLAVFEKKLAIVRALERFADLLLEPGAVETAAVEEQVVSAGEVGHQASPEGGGRQNVRPTLNI